MVEEKALLRKQLRKARREHVKAQPEAIRALLFNRPPAQLMELVPARAVIGLYHATPFEAPTASYARYFLETGHDLALPCFKDSASDMAFAKFSDPFAETDLQEGAFGMMQPSIDARVAAPDVLIMPLIGFTAAGARLGQGGGHYDRYLSAHPQTLRIGLAWDVQLCDKIPTEPHDMPLNAVITPTRMYGPF